MGSVPSRHLKVERYKWSSAEFPQEYAFIYTTIENEFESSIFWVSVSPNKVLARLVDHMCRNPRTPVRIRMEVNAEKYNENGDWDFREVVVAADRTNFKKVQNVSKGEVRYGYSTDTMYSLCELIPGYGFGNFGPTHWVVRHEYNVDRKYVFNQHVDRRKLISSLSVRIHCDKVKGLYVDFGGPSKYKGMIEREQAEGKAPKNFIEEVESDFESEVYTLFNQRGEDRKTVFNQREEEHGTGASILSSSTTVYRSN